MSGFIKILGSFFGKKYDKDIKEITPIIEKINAEFSSLSSISNDELRKKTISFKEKINAFVSKEKHEITILKEESIKKITTPEENTYILSL